MKELVCNIAVKNLIENEDMKNFLRLVEVYRDSEEKDRRSAEALGIMIDLIIENAKQCSRMTFKWEGGKK